MRTRSAKTVPPGPAMGPSMVRAARKMEKVAKVRVSSWASIPLGGQTTPHRLKLKVKTKVKVNQKRWSSSIQVMF